MKLETKKNFLLILNMQINSYHFIAALCMSVFLSASDSYVRLKIRVFPWHGVPTTYNCTISRKHTFDDLLESFYDIYPQFVEHKERMLLLTFPHAQNIEQLLSYGDNVWWAGDTIVHLVEGKKR